MNTVFRSKSFLVALVTLVLLYSPSVFSYYSIPPGIGTPTTIGTWDSVNRVFTLTTDITESITIRENDLTLNGNGHTSTGINISPRSWVPGVHLPGLSGVTVTGLTVEGFSVGI